MRVVYLNPCGQLGGAETSLRELLASMRASRSRLGTVVGVGRRWAAGRRGAKARSASDTGAAFSALLWRGLGDAGTRPAGMGWQLLQAAAASCPLQKRAWPES